MIDFLGIGAQKCGTTWLFQHLARHPLIQFPAGKEIHFWDTQPGHDVHTWLAHFEGPAGPLRGEITPAYGPLSVTVIRDIRATCPEVRLFYSLRNPIARAWSSALMALARAELTTDEVSDQWFIDHFRSKGSLARGDYVGCLENWLTVFPRHQLHLIWFDDIVARPHDVLLDLAAHLGVDAQPFLNIPDAALRQPVLEGPGERIRPSLLNCLREIYLPKIAALEKTLSRDLSRWKI